MKKILLLTLLASSIVAKAQPDIRTLYAEALEAHKAKDYVTFLRRFQQLDSINPEHPTVTYNLGAAYALNNQPNLAMKYVQKALLMNAAFEPEKDADFGSLDAAQLAALAQVKQVLLAEVRTGETFFTNTEKDLHPESVAFDPASGDYFLNSVRKGKIIRYNPMTKSYSEFSTGHWAIMGMRVHKGQLWACEVATPEHIGFDKENEGKSALLQFDLKSGELFNRIELDGGHWFGDVLISKSGRVYVSDSRQPVIYTLVNEQFEVFQDFSKRLHNLQGLAFSADESRLYIADYKVGIHVLDMATKSLTKLSQNEDVATKGTDGLYFYKNSLITIQNGVAPFRVTRLYLDKSGKSIERISYLDKAIPELGEPTLGVIVGHSLVYVANSPWGAYKGGNFIVDGRPDNLIMKIDLK